MEFLAIFDSIVLTLNIIPIITAQFVDTLDSHIISPYCKTIYTIVSMSGISGVYIIVAMTVDWLMAMK